MKITLPFYCIKVKDFFETIASFNGFELEKGSFVSILLPIVQDILESISLAEVAHISYSDIDTTLFFEVNNGVDRILRSEGFNVDSLAITNFDLDVH